MSQRKLRVGVVGAGHLGTIHTRLLRTIDDVELVGVVDPIPEARQRIAKDFQVPVYEEHRKLLGRVDAVVLASPTEHHYWIGMELAEAGIHLLIEKPLTLSAAEADALIRVATAKNLVLQVGHVERFNPAFTAAASHIQHPRLIEAVRASGYTGLELVRILSAQEQVVAGMNYRLKLRVKLNGAEKDAEAVVWWQAWREPEPYRLTSWRWEE